MPNDVDLLVRTSRAVGGVLRTVGELAVPVAVVDAGVPMHEVEVLFRSPHLPCLAVLAAGGRVGMVSRARFTDAQTGRLGFGRAVLARRPVEEVADWSPLVVDEGTGVVEAATLAMERAGSGRYDDVLVRSQSWSAVATSDLVRALVAALSSRALHDPLTGLPGRDLVLHTVRSWARMLAGSERRLLLVQTDVVGFAAVNAWAGADPADALLRALAARLVGAVPSGSVVGRTGSDELMAVLLLRAVPPAQAGAQVAGVVEQVERALAPRGVREPEVRVSAAVSGPGVVDIELLVREAQRGMLARKADRDRALGT
ncbi:MAG TPA: diguanylate cyclase [Cellulomonas sp.]